MSDRVIIFDTTLRDGEQCPGASLNPQQKLEIARQLDRLGVDVIEAGFAVSSPGDFEGVNIVASQVKRPVIASLSRAVPRDIEAAGQALKPAKRRRIKTVMQELIYLAGRVITKGRRVTLRLSRHCPAFEVFDELYACLAYG